MAAAVADFKPATYEASKIKKTESDHDLSLPLERTTDILAELGRQKQPLQILVGFALETNDGQSNAIDKLKRKNLDLIVLNNPKEEGAGFGKGTNRVDIISASGEIEALPIMSKREVAQRILDRVLHLTTASA